MKIDRCHLEFFSSIFGIFEGGFMSILQFSLVDSMTLKIKFIG